MFNFTYLWTIAFSTYHHILKRPGDIRSWVSCCEAAQHSNAADRRLNIKFFLSLRLQGDPSISRIKNNRSLGGAGQLGAGGTHADLAATIAAALVVASAIGIGVAFPVAVANVGGKGGAISRLVYIAADRNELAVASHLNGTLLTLGTVVAIARVLANTLGALRLGRGRLTAHAVGTANLAALSLVAVALALANLVVSIVFNRIYGLRIIIAIKYGEHKDETFPTTIPVQS